MSWFESAKRPNSIVKAFLDQTKINDDRQPDHAPDPESTDVLRYGVFFQKSVNIYDQQ